MNAQTYFDEKLPKDLEKSPDKGKDLNAVFYFKINGDGGGEWTVDFKSEPATVQKGDAGTADCRIEMENSDFEAMMDNFQLAMQFYFQGKLKVSGDPMLATKLQSVFS